MAGRQNKVGLDYFELDCHMDDKIKLIEAEFGLKGFAIIIKLFQSIYSGSGYYCEWSPDISLLWAMQLGISPSGGGKGLGIATGEVSLSGSQGRFGTAVDTSLSDYPDNLINKVIAASIRRDIFSRELFNRYRILTSSGIQKRYLNATSKREKVELKKEYLLISVPLNRKNVVINSISGAINSISGARNEQSRVKKSKENNILCAPDDKSPCAGKFLLNDATEYEVSENDVVIYQQLYPGIDVKQELRGMEAWCLSNPKNRKTRNGAKRFMNAWLSRAQNSAQTQNRTRAKPAGFNDFPQRDYDFAALEAKLIEN